METLMAFFSKTETAPQNQLAPASGEEHSLAKTFRRFSFAFKANAAQGNCFAITASTPLLSAEEVGGKAHNVIKLFRMGVTLPESFVVTCAEFSKGAKTQTVSDEVKKVLALNLDASSRYAVRSSANIEDGADSAFAGRFTTELNVPGSVDAICAAIVKCWNSMNALDLADIVLTTNARMGVVIMRQIDSKKAGVLFQANPITGSRATYVITAAYGQGEGVVGGKLAVDTYSLKEKDLSIRTKQVSKKERMLILSDSEGTKEVPVPTDQQEIPCLSDPEIHEVAAAGKKIRSNCASPQDVEFAFDAKGKLYILQTRPITTLAETLNWKAPDAGLWQLNGHLPTPMSKFYAPMWIAGQSRGGFECTVYTGAGVQAMDATEINGFAYFCMRNAGPKAAPKALPPPFILRNIIRLTGRKAIRDAQAFWTKKLWRTFMEEEFPKRKQEWHSSVESWKRKLETVTSLSDTQLAELMTEAQLWGGHMYGEHAGVTMYNLSPVAYFVMRAMEVTKCQAVDGFNCLGGFSAVSLGLGGEFPEQIKIIAQDDALVQVLTEFSKSSDLSAARAKLLELEQRKEESASLKALADIVEAIKYRLVEGYDSANSTLLECPTLIFQSLMDGVHKMRDNTLEKARERGLACGEEILAKVQDPKVRAELEELLAEARLVAGVRDERAILTDLVAMGIIHHLLLECGKRLAARSPTPVDETLILLASREEIVKYLQDKGRAAVPESVWKELADRKKYRQEASIMDAPPTINGSVLVPTKEHFPDPLMARSVHTIIFSIDQIFAAPDLELTSNDVAISTQNDKNVIIGFSGSTGVCKGRAFIVRSAQDAANLQPGDICVTQYPSSIVNLILGKASGIVTDLGGILCHAAICAREAELPCVVGCHTATSRIKTGDMIEVDGGKGLIRIIVDQE